jgi:hypothetical protein
VYFITVAEWADLMVTVFQIHPCGRYRHNTLVFLLGRVFGLTNLYSKYTIQSVSDLCREWQ